MSLPKFYVGQKVVCLVDTYSLQEGKIYTVTTVDTNCKCGSIGVGILPDTTHLHCDRCNITFEQAKDRLFPAPYFQPLIEEYQSISFEKVIENEKVCVN